MPELPSGTVTFLFTDVESSTQLLHQLGPEPYAKALASLGIPTYGFAPLKLGPEVPFLSLFHGHDERVPVTALAFGLPVLHEVVSRFTSAEPA